MPHLDTAHGGRGSLRTLRYFGPKDLGEQVQGVARRQTYVSNTTIRGESEEEVLIVAHT